MDAKEKLVFRRNRKTVMSFDCTSICHKVRAGNPCAYCYVETSRAEGICAKNKYDYVSYDHWVLRLRPDTVDKLNSCGGIRMFSFGDYEARFRKDVKAFLDDCQFRGIKAKAITKVPMFVKHFHDHPALAVIHVSIDSLKGKGGSGISYERAKDLRKKFHKVLVRCVCLNPDDLEFFGKQRWVDIITLNHGRNSFHFFDKKERDEAGKRYSGRMCCSTGICVSCDVKCRSAI